MTKFTQSKRVKMPGTKDSRRIDRLNAVARRLGFSTWRVLETAVIHARKVTIVLDGAVSGDEQ